MGVRNFIVSYAQFCSLKRAAEFGKTCPQLSEIEHIMCECAEIDLEPADDYFRGNEGNCEIVFSDWELKVSALENASRILRVNASSVDGYPRLVMKDFPEFSEARQVKGVSNAYSWPYVWWLGFKDEEADNV